MGTDPLNVERVAQKYDEAVLTDLERVRITSLRSNAEKEQAGRMDLFCELT